MSNIDPMEYRILIVDDDPRVRQLLKLTLQQAGYDLTIAEHAGIASELLRKERFDIVLSDYHMPGMNGVELLRLARIVQPESIRIILTAHADTAMAIEAINQGEVYRFMVKPWNQHELLLNLNLACEQVRLRREVRRLSDAVRERDAMIQRLTGKRPIARTA